MSKNLAAVALQKLSWGKAKHYSPEEKIKRAARLTLARLKRWEPKVDQAGIDKVAS